jgi:glycosyltransferase involved in cell wall biosynthesis/SAM-dependent methyltransferase
LFEEKLAIELPDVRRYGMNGRLYRGDPHAGWPPKSVLTFDVLATVEENQSEVGKYAALASQVVGRPLQLSDPRLQPNDESLARAKQSLADLGMEPYGYWIAAVAGTAHVSLKQWRTDAWGEVFAEWSEKFGRKFLFVGLDKERPALDAVRQAMGTKADRAAVWTGHNESLPELLALTAMSSGYAGHDTGPMHMAAALGKPVLAVFGGGTWPRFVPAIEPSCSITVGLPCVGCGWSCTFHKAHCIVDVPVEEVKRAVEEIETGKISGRERRVIPATEARQAAMLREAAETIRGKLRENGELIRQVHDVQALAKIHEEHAAEVLQLRSRFEAQIRDSEARHAEQTAQLSSQLSQVSSALADLSANFAKTVEQLSQSSAQLHAQLAQAMQTTAQLSERIAAIEPKPKPKPREPWKIRVGKWIAGKSFFVPLLGYRSLPRISIVTPVKNGEEWIEQTILSVIGQGYAELQYVVVDGGSTDGTLQILERYRDRIDRIISEPDEGMYDAIAKGLDICHGSVLGYLNADDALEPGGLLRVGEYFRDHPRASVIYHEDTVIRDGWRFPNIAQPRVDVYMLLAGHTLFQDGVFFRTTAYRAVGGLNRSLKRAGDWDLFARLARMWGLRRVRGHVSSFRIRKGQISEDRVAYDAELTHAKAAFLRKFGIAGRVRCRVIQAINVIRNGVERALVRRKFFWPGDYCGKPLPPGDGPPLIPNQPISPLTGRAPDRLLFSTRDTRFGDPRIHYVYLESETRMAMAYPPLTQDQLTELYEKHYSQPIKAVIEPDPRFHSPFRNFKGGNIIARNLSRIPSPWWWFQKITYHDDAAAEILQSVRRRVRTTDQTIRFLDVGCFEGDLLEKLKDRTKWKLFGLEANANAVQIARSKGHSVWQATAEDAPLVVPEDSSFDVIFLGQTMEHLDDPLIALNRLRGLLSPGGIIVLTVPNLDSKQVELFGPTWAHWHMPYHRTLLSRKALRRMAKLAGMHVDRLRTRSHPYWTTMSVQLNRLGLGAVVPHTAYFSNVMAMHGTRLTGWSRLLWDWRGRGDYMFAVLRAV